MPASPTSRSKANRPVNALLLMARMSVPERPKKLVTAERTSSTV